MNMLLMLVLSFMMVLLSLIINFSHLLLSLLCLEGLTLITMMLITSLNNSLMIQMSQISLIILTFSACEASLGLSMIVKLSRSHGSDLLSMSAINSC